MDRLICSPAYNNVHSRAISDHSGPSVGHVLHSHTIDAGQCIMYKLAHVYLSGLQSETFYHSILFLFYFCYTDCPPLRSTGKVSFCVTRMHPPPPCVETCASPSCEKKKEHLPWPGGTGVPREFEKKKSDTNHPESIDWPAFEAHVHDR